MDFGPSSEPKELGSALMDLGPCSVPMELRLSSVPVELGPVLFL